MERRALLAQQAKLRGESVSTRSPLAVLNYMDENASPAPAPRVAACQRMKPDRAAAQSKMVTEQALLDLCEHLLSDQRAQAIVLDGKLQAPSTEPTITSAGAVGFAHYQQAKATGLIEQAIAENAAEAEAASAAEVEAAKVRQEGQMHVQEAVAVGAVITTISGERE